MPLSRRGAFSTAAAAISLAGITLIAPSPASAGIISSLLSGLAPTTTQVTNTVEQTVPAAAPIVDTATAVVAPVTSTGSTCATLPTTKAFARYGDTADYSAAPGGTFEKQPAAGVTNNATSPAQPGWALTKGAALVKGNETGGVASGQQSLLLGRGAVAISPAFCVSAANPHFRFMMKSNSFMNSYQALVLYRDAAGTLTQAQFVSSSSTRILPGLWGPSDPSPLATKIPLLQGGATASVQILLRADSGATQIDFVMVDPYRRG